MRFITPATSTAVAYTARLVSTQSHFKITSKYNLHGGPEKTAHQTRGHNFEKSQPIFKVVSLEDSLVNLQ